MAKKEYVEAPELHEYVDWVLQGAKFALLRESKARIKVVLCVTTDKEDSPEARSGSPVVLRKVHDALKPYMRADYVVDIDQYTWDNAATNRLREGMMASALCQIEVDKKDDKYILKKRQPDEVIYYSVLDAYPEQYNVHQMAEFSARALEMVEEAKERYRRKLLKEQGAEDDPPENEEEEEEKEEEQRQENEEGTVEEEGNDPEPPETRDLEEEEETDDVPRPKARSKRRLPETTLRQDLRQHRRENPPKPKVHIDPDDEHEEGEQRSTVPPMTGAQKQKHRSSRVLPD